MELVLGIDLGTSYFKLGLFDRAGEPRGLGRVSVPTEVGGGSLCELAVEDFWSALREGLRQALQQADAKDSDIQAMGYSSQANSFVLLDEHDKPLTPLILWPDSREEEIDPAVLQLWQREDFFRITGLGIQYSEQFAIAKMKWFQRHQPDVWARTSRIMMISDYLVFSLTGQAFGDGGTASLLGLLDLQRNEWWDEALRSIGISPSQLSALLSPGTVAGRVTAEGSARLGLKPGIPLAVGSLDHHVAAIGAGVGQLPQFSESTGTVLACLCLTDGYNPIKNCCVGPGIGGKGYYQLAFDGNGASALEWYHRNHAPQISIPDLVDMAENVPPGSNGLVALPSANNYPDFNGFRNLTADHKHGHFVRAIMESTAASLAVLVDRLCPEARPRRIVATGGGARSNPWLQIKADMLDVEFVTSTCSEPACLGAAMLAAVAAGWFEGLDGATKDFSSTSKTFRPNSMTHKNYALWHKHYLETATKP